MFSIIVSVIIPCFNQSHFLEESVNSVINQTFVDLECIIVNDGSDDDTEIIAQQLMRKDKRIKYILKENGGLSAARNTGIKAANGKYILPLDADDLLQTNYINAAISIIETEKNIRLVYTGTQLFGTEEGVRNEPFLLKNFMLNNLIPCTALYYKDDWHKVGGYNEKMKQGYEDWDFWMSLLENGINVKKIDKLLFKYRRTENSMSKNMNVESILNIQAEIYNRHKEFYLRILGDPLTLSLRIKDLERQLALIKKSVSFSTAKKISRFIKFFKKK
jgi:glycosyltransferase involved in cell wall biosynthesis